MADRVLRGNETVLLIPAYVRDGQAFALHEGGMVPINALTTAVLNRWIPANTANHSAAQGGGNVSCAIKDDMTLGLTDSEADSDRTLCDVGQVEELTTRQYEGSMNGFLDKDRAANGAYNLFRNLTFGPDVPFIVAHRIGVKQTEPAVVGELWDAYLFDTDVPIPGYGNNANITIGQTFIPKSNAPTAQKLAA